MDLDENYSKFMMLYTQSVPILRSFLRKLLPNWQDVDEVLQNTSLVLWKKFEQYEEGTEFSKWACVIGRYEVLRYKRSKARDRHYFGDDLLELLAEENISNHDRLEAERKALQVCLNKLDDKQKKITLSAYSGQQNIKEVAETYGRTATAMYKALKRIRTNLMGCIKKEVSTI